MSEQDIFILSEQALKNIIDQIKDDQWTLKPSAELTYGRDYDLKGVINAHARDDAWVADVLAGKTIDEVGDKYEGDLLGDDPKASYAAINTKSQEVVKGFTEPDMIVHLSYGDFPARDYLKHITFYRGAQAPAIARFIGVNDRLPAELVQGMWDEIIPDIELWRQMGVAKDEVPAPEGADLQTQLFCKLGMSES